MASGVVTLRGRFKPGARVRLVRVKDESVLRVGDGSELVASEVVDAEGCVRFAKGVVVGARYFVAGQVDGTPLEVRCRGNRPDEDNSLLTQVPVLPERQKLADGRFQDEVVVAGAPRRAEEHPVGEAPAAEEVPAKKSAGKSTTAKSARGSARKEK